VTDANKVALELPADGFANVGRLVIAGFASQTGISVEAVDDLQLAVELLLARVPLREHRAAIELTATESGFAVAVGRFHEGALDTQLAGRLDEGLDLRTVLEHLVGRFELDRTSTWLTLRLDAEPGS